MVKLEKGYRIEVVVKERSGDHWRKIDKFDGTPKETVMRLLNKYVDSQYGVVERLEKAIRADWEGLEHGGRRLGKILKEELFTFKRDGNEK